MDSVEGHVNCSSSAMECLGSMVERLAILHCGRRTPWIVGGGNYVVGFELR